MFFSPSDSAKIMLTVLSLFVLIGGVIGFVLGAWIF